MLTLLKMERSVLEKGLEETEVYQRAYSEFASQFVNVYEALGLRFLVGASEREIRDGRTHCWCQGKCRFVNPDHLRICFWWL